MIGALCPRARSFSFSIFLCPVVTGLFGLCHRFGRFSFPRTLCCLPAPWPVAPSCTSRLGVCAVRVSQLALAPGRCVRCVQGGRGWHGVMEHEIRVVDVPGRRRRRLFARGGRRSRWCTRRPAKGRRRWCSRWCFHRGTRRTSFSRRASRVTRCVPLPPLPRVPAQPCEHP